MKVCSIQNCNRPALARGYCSTHYSRWKDYGDPNKLKRENVQFVHPPKCSVPNCDRPYEAKGYCNYHYVDLIRRFGQKNTKCKIGSCDTGVYAKGYCFKHYYSFKRYGVVLLMSKCKYPNCTRTTKYGYCSKHKNIALRRLAKNIPVTLSKSEAIKGKYNHRWSGGPKKGEYYDHYKMKQARKAKISLTNGMCEKCGSKGYVLHHKDQSNMNHSLDNLLFLCRACHIVEHQAMGTKYGRHKKVEKQA